MVRTRVVIQTRLNSSRLPGKALLTVAGMPLVELVARRAGRSGHEVVVATSQEPYDERIASHLASVGISVVRGSLDDVLGRFVDATRDLAENDLVVRLTGDNPIGDAALVDELVSALEISGERYGRVDIDRAPEGIGAEVFRARDLREAARVATDAYDREHVTPWIRRNVSELLFVPQGCPGDPHAYRATVDTLGDYVRVASLFDDVPDPVGVHWLELMRILAARVDALGARVSSLAVRGGRQSRLILSARTFSEGIEVAAPAEHTERLRALLAGAVDRGVTHVDVGRADGRSEELLRGCAEPALTKRFSLILRVAPPTLVEATPVARALALEASAERSFAELGRRGVDVLVFPDVASAESGWARATQYRDDGLIRRLGLVLTSADAVTWALAREDVDYVEVASAILDGASAVDDVVGALTVLRERGVAVCSVISDAGQVRDVPAWATSVILATWDAGELDRAIRASAAASG